MAGATDGVVSIWDSQDINNDSMSTLSPVFSLRCHMSGINAIDVLECEGVVGDTTEDTTCVLLGTGGDDNAIHLHLLRVSKKNRKISQIRTASVVKAHSAQITGLKFFKSDFDSISLASVSIDQRLTQWSIVINGDNKEIAMRCDSKSSTLTNIADVSSFDSCTGYSEKQIFHYYFICGQGIEIQRLKDVL